MGRYKVLLGGLGDDAHSIGISLLRIALEERGYLVSFLGIQNTIHDFIKFSESHDIIIVSCINGHSELYLNNEYNLKKLKCKGNKLWYVGGNLSVDKDEEYIIKLYMEKGFTRVFPKPIDVDETLFYIKRDIEKYNVFPEYEYVDKVNFSKINLDIENIKDYQNITEEDFQKERKEILKSWKTGKDVSYEKAIENHKKCLNLDNVLWNSKCNNRGPIVQPRTGVADIEKQLELLTELKKKGIGVASIQLDAASRRLYFEKAEEGLEKSLISGKSMLNGFPIPIYGVNGVEQLSQKLELPFQIRGGAPDHRFVYEVGIAGGASSIEGGFLCYLLPYEKQMSPNVSLNNWIYVDRLCGLYYNEMKININREFFGPLTTTLLEPCIPITINIIEAILAAKQGVKSISLGIAEQGNRSQDIAALMILEELTNKYLNKYGLHGVRITTVFHQYMGAFPSNEVKAEELIMESSITATLGKATKIMTKTPVEAFKIPSVEDNSRGIELTKKGIEMAGDIKFDANKVYEEKKLIYSEVVCLMNIIEELGEGRIEIGAIKAILDGIIDVPFSPNIYNKGEVIGFRNINGAIRFANCDKMPFPEWIKEIHKNDLLKRMNSEREYKMYSIIEKDLTRIWKCDYKKWPLDYSYLI